MSTRTIVMGQERRNNVTVTSVKPPRPEVKVPEPVKPGVARQGRASPRLPPSPPKRTPPRLTPEVKAPEPEVKAPEKCYAYKVVVFEDLQKTKKLEDKFYENGKSLMKDLEISKTTFYKYLKLGEKCPKSYIIEKINE